MPVHTVIINGIKKYRWGNHGKLYPYTSKGKAKAAEQGRSAFANKYKEKNK